MNGFGNSELWPAVSCKYTDIYFALSKVTQIDLGKSNLTI
jgi:hypothetical protein